MMNNRSFTDDDRHRMEVLLMEVACQNNEGFDNLTQTACTENSMKSAILCFARSISFLNDAMNMGIDSAELGFEQRFPSPFSCEDAPGLQDESSLYVQCRLTTFDPIVFNTRSGINIVSMILLFNLGIACHSLGLKCQDEEMVNKAMRIYDICAGAVAQTCDTDHDWGVMHDLAWAFSVGAKNNRAVLSYQCFGKRGEAINLLKNLCSDIHEFCVTNNEMESGVLEAAEASDVFLNFVILQSPVASIAAKAA